MGIGALIVDDQQDARQLMRVVIEEANGELFVSGEAASGEEAIERISEFDPEVVLLDYVMPVIDGLETARRIRAVRPEQPIIIFSAFVDDELEQRARALGVARCVSKVDFMRIPATMRAVAGAS